MSIAERQPCAGYARLPHPSPCSQPPVRGTYPDKSQRTNSYHLSTATIPAISPGHQCGFGFDAPTNTRGHADRTSNPPLHSTPQEKADDSTRTPRFLQEEANEENTCDPFASAAARVGPDRARADHDGKNTENVTTFGMGYGLRQYSPLRQINKSNVKRLVPVWSTSLMQRDRASSRSRRSTTASCTS